MIPCKIKSVLLAAVLIAACHSVGFAAENEAMVGQSVRKNGASIIVQASAKNFTGTAWVENLLRPQAPSKIYAATVRFEVGARTNWHIHSIGQALIVTSGFGYTQEWGKPITTLQLGDVVWCPPGIKHWHGAGRRMAMMHIAVSEASEKGITWLERISDQQYPN